MHKSEVHSSDSGSTGVHEHFVNCKISRTVGSLNPQTVDSKTLPGQK